MIQRIHTTRKVAQRGFTLVELLVSVMIFSVVMTVSVGALLVLIDANEKGQGIQTVMTNLSFALDSMTRQIRTGRNYYCATNMTSLPTGTDYQDCGSGDAIAFIDGRTGDRVGFRFEDSNPNDKYIQRNVNGGGWIRVTSPGIFVENFNITVDGTGGLGNTEQPTVEILVQGYIVDGIDTDTDFTLQTLVTQRSLDL